MAFLDGIGPFIRYRANGSIISIAKEARAPMLWTIFTMQWPAIVYAAIVGRGNRGSRMSGTTQPTSTASQHAEAAAAFAVAAQLVAGALAQIAFERLQQRLAAVLRQR